MYIFRSMDVYILAVGVEGIHILRPDDACVFGKYGQTHFFACQDLIFRLTFIIFA